MCKIPGNYYGATRNILLTVRINLSLLGPTMNQIKSETGRAIPNLGIFLTSIYKVTGNHSEYEYSSVFVSCDSCKIYHKLNSLKKQKWIFSQFWGSEAWNEEIGRAMPPLNTVENNLPLPLPTFWCAWAILGVSWLRNIFQLLPLSHPAPLCVLSSFYKDTTHRWISYSP